MIEIDKAGYEQGLELLDQKAKIEVPIKLRIELREGLFEVGEQHAQALEDKLTHQQEQDKQEEYKGRPEVDYHEHALEPRFLEELIEGLIIISTLVVFVL